MFNFDGFKLGLIGFTNEDAPTLVFPGAFGPFHVDDATAAVNAEAAKLKAQKDRTRSSPWGMLARRRER